MIRIAFAALLICSSAKADPVKVKLNYIPAGTAYTVPEVGQVRYYLFEEYKLLLKLDHDLYISYMTMDELRLQNADLRELANTYKKESEEEKVQKQVYVKRSERLSGKLDECQEALAKEKGIDLASLFIGGAAGMAVGVIGAVVVVALVK